MGGVWKLQVKNSKHSMAKKGHKWPSQNVPGIQTMIFSKKATRVVSTPKIMSIYGRYRPKHSKMAILAKKGQILTIFGHFGGRKIFWTKNFFSGRLSGMETYLHAKNQKQACVAMVRRT